MSIVKRDRRDFLKGTAALAASSLLPNVANAVGIGGAHLRGHGGWIPTSAIGRPSARASAVGCTLNDRIFFYGGNLTGSTFTSTHYWFDADLNAWQQITSTGTVPAGRDRYGVATNGTGIFVWGGRNTTAATRLNSGGYFVPSGAAGGAWTASTATGAPSPREYPGVVSLQGKFIGWGGRLGTTDYADGGIYDPVADTWTALPAIGQNPRYSHAMVAISPTKFLLWGGINSANVILPDHWIYDIVANTWTQVSYPSYVSIPFPAAVWTGSRVFIWGGGAGVCTMYDPATDSYTYPSTTNIPIGGGFASCYVSTSGKIVAFSDTRNGGIYDPVADNWRPFPSTTGPQSPLQAMCVGYAKNRLVVWGGYISSTRQNVGWYYVPTGEAP